MSPLFSTLTRPIIIGHRGASGHALENSAAAFALAASVVGPARCDGVELDVHTSSDGGFVVHHDPSLSGGAAIATTPLCGVRDSLLSDGSVIPTLAEALVLLDSVEVFVEAKGLPAAADQEFLATLATHRRSAVHVHSFDHRIIARLRQRDPLISLGVLAASYPVRPIEPVKDAGATTLWQEADLIDGALVAACHDAGYAVIGWTVNDPAVARRLTELGVDGLCGNWPERLRTALQ